MLNNVTLYCNYLFDEQYLLYTRVYINLYIVSLVHNKSSRSTSSPCFARKWFNFR